jgi:aminopeptidase N
LKISRKGCSSEIQKFELLLIFNNQTFSLFKRHPMRKLLIVLVLPALLWSCVATRLNYFGETPKRPGRYPAFTARDSLKGYLDRYRSCYDVTYYDLDLDLEPENKRLSGDVTIFFRAVDTLNMIRIDLNKKFRINNISMDGKLLSFARKGGAVYVSLMKAMVAGNSYSIKVSYAGSPPAAVNPPWKGGFVWKEDMNGEPWIGVTCEGEGGSIWFPCKDHLSDEPDSMRLQMSVPAGLKVVSNGLPQGHSFQQGKEKFIWGTHYPINIYNITFYAGRFVEIADTMKAGSDLLNLNYWVLPANREKAENHFRQVKDVIRIYSRAFGPYPWIKEGFKLIESPYEGMEHQTAIAYGNSYQDIQLLGADYIIVHEAAHEWWGNAVSVSDFSDIWLQEGFATYAEVVYAESKKGYDASLDYIYYWIASGIRNKYPVVGPKDVNYWDYHDGDVYNKGALILHTMRNIINDSTLFFDILQTFYREHACGTHVTTSDFREVVERKTGSSWEKFFEAYLYSRNVPVLKWYFGTWDTNKTDQDIPVSFVAARWTNVPDGFSMPVTLTCKKTGLSETVDVTTKTRIFYLGKFSTCEQLSCNLKHSYFTGATGKDLLDDRDAEIIGEKGNEVIAINYQ